MNTPWWSCVVVWSVSCAGCGMTRPELPTDLLVQQPRVVEILPAEKSVVIHFSTPIDERTFHRDSAVVMHDADPTLPIEDLLDGIEARQWPTVDGVYQVSADGLEGAMLPTVSLEGGRRYAVIITPAVRSRGGVPLSQTPGGKATPFVGRFAVSADDMEQGSAETQTSSSPPVASTHPGGGMPAPTPAPAIAPRELMIHEVYYDAVGSDTNGLLFVELRATPGADVGGYRLHFINGDGGTVLESVTLPDGTTIPPDGLLVVADGMTGNLKVTQVAGADLIDNFDPQNGPESVQLVTPGGTLVDVVGYGEPLPPHGENGLALYEGAPAPDAPAGKSIQRSPGSPDTDNNAADFSVGDPTPGVE